MWESISTVLNGSNAIFILIFAVIVMGTVVVGIKKGWFSLNTKTIKLGYMDKEREIIKYQIQYAKGECQDLTNDYISKLKDIDEFKVRYAVEKVYDDFLDIISLNHINKEDIYVNLKSNLLWGTISNIITIPELENEFKDRVKKDLYNMHDIRQFYMKSN